LSVVLDEELPLGGAGGHSKPVSLTVALPHTHAKPGLDDFFDDRGRSLVAARAALVQPTDAPEARVEQAVRAGAAAVLVYGGRVPAGALGLGPAAPTVAPPSRAAAAILAAPRRRQGAGVSVGRGS